MKLAGQLTASPLDAVMPETRISTRVRSDGSPWPNSWKERLHLIVGE